MSATTWRITPLAMSPSVRKASAVEMVPVAQSNVKAATSNLPAHFTRKGIDDVQIRQFVADVSAHVESNIIQVVVDD